MQISGIASLRQATRTEISFYNSNRHHEEFRATRAAAVIVTHGVDVSRAANDDSPFVRPPPKLLFVENADVAMIDALRQFAPPPAQPYAGVHPSATVAASAVISRNVSVGAQVVIGDGTIIGQNTVIHPGVCIGAFVTIGADCEIFPNVVLRDRITVGQRVSIHAGSIIGTDGFGYRWDGKQHEKIPQIGTVVIEDDVEIGSCTCIDRAKFATTRIGRGSKIDNLVQIGHNVTIGPACLIAGQSGVAGSVTLEAGVALGGQAALRDHITIGNNTIVAGGSVVYSDIPASTTVSGNPAGPHRHTLREQVAVKRLPEIMKQLQQLQRQVNELSGRLLNEEEG